MRQAIALRYDHEKENAPKVVAKGKGVNAQKIIDIANEHNLPIKEDPDLIELLSKVEIDHEIPENLYIAVAEVFKFIYTLTSRTKTNASVF